MTEGLGVRIAVTSRGETLDSPVDPRFGRARGFVIVDTGAGEFRFIDNVQNLTASQGAGIQAAQNVSRYDVDCVITGHCGPKAFRTLSAAGIKVVTGGKGTVAEAVAMLEAGKLTTAETADVEGHWV